MMQAIRLLMAAALAAGLTGCGPSESSGKTSDYDDGSGAGKKPPLIVYNQRPERVHIPAPEPAAAEPTPEFDAPDSEASGPGAAESPSTPKPPAPQKNTVTRSARSSTNAGETPGKNSIKQRDRRAPGSGPVSIKQLTMLIDKGGLKVGDRTPELVPLYRRALENSAKEIGANEAAVLDVGEHLSVLVVSFSDPAAMQTLLRSPPEGLVTYRNVLLTLASKPSGDWETLVQIMEGHGGKRVESNARESFALLSQLHRLRAQLELYKAKENRYPDFAASQWNDMVSGNYITSPPRNPLAMSSVADTIELVTTMGSTGELVSHSKAGWVWNTVDEKLYAAGVNEDKLVLACDGVPGGKHFLALPELHVGHRLDRIRDAYEHLTALNNAQKKKSAVLLADLQQFLTKTGGCPANPINESREIQPAIWAAKNPPVSGGAGWNYDPKAGKIWANSSVVGENRF
jgi:hypothetical protein